MVYHLPCLNLAFEMILRGGRLDGVNDVESARAFFGTGRLSPRVFEVPILHPSVDSKDGLASYKRQMIEVRQTAVFRDWLAGLADARAVERIAQRIVRLRGGLFGDAKPVGGGVSELRIDYGPGYRV